MDHQASITRYRIFNEPCNQLMKFQLFAMQNLNFLLSIKLMSSNRRSRLIVPPPSTLRRRLIFAIKLIILAKAGTRRVFSRELT